MSQPLFTVMIPNYNMAAYLPRSLESVLQQTCGDFELLVMDNRSTDGSWERVLKFADARIRPYRQTANLQLYPNLNVGLMLARGRYLKVQCADDVMHPCCLAVLKQGIDRYAGAASLPLYLGHGIVVGGTGCEETPEWLRADLEQAAAFRPSALLSGLSSGLPSACAATDPFREFGGFGPAEPSRDFSRDLLRFGLFSVRCQCFQTDAPLVFERAHPGQNRHLMSKRWQLREIYELYAGAGLLDNPAAAAALRKLAGYHLAFALKALVRRRDLGYLAHTLAFSSAKGLIGRQYLRAFLSRFRTGGGQGRDAKGV